MLPRLAMPRPGYESVVLVTGFPSFLAKKLVLHLVASEPRTLVIAVVLPKLMVEARHVTDALDPADRERVVMIEGDAAAIDLGLSGVELRQLARDVDRIHHVAHASYLGVDRATAETLNVVGAAEIVEVAKLMTGLRCLVFHSTAFVSGDRRGTIYEEDPPTTGSFPSLVEETRAKGEQLVRRAGKSLPIAIVRPTMIVGDSGTGEVERLDLPYLFVLLLLAAPADLTLPIPSRGDPPLHVVPIDFVVRAACAIGRDPRAPGRTFHLVDPSPLPVRRFIETIRQIRERRASWIELRTFARSVLRTPGIEGFLRSPKALVDQLFTSVRYDSANADMVLGPLGITCPPVDSYAEKIVIAVEERLVGRASPPAPSTRDVRASIPGSAPADTPREEAGAETPHHDADAMD
jgi:thioester reductase-like protein